MGAYKQVRSIGRGLDVLAAVSQEPGMSIASISATTGIHRTTVYRLLETLETLGYVRRRVCDDNYCVTWKARALGNRCDENTQVLDAAAPRLRELIDEIDWPSSLAMMNSDAMVIRDTTHGRSRIFVHDAGVGTRLPILTSAAGRAWIAFCPDDERSAIIEMLARSETPERGYARDSAYVDRVIGSTVDRGYAVSMGEARSWLTGIAMPIRRDRRVVACVNIVLLTSALRNVDIAEFLPVLERKVDAIERSMCAA